MSEIPILTFAPLLKELVWGGQKLGSVLNKPLPSGAPFGESWEIVDLPSDQSAVSAGPLRGRTLAELLEAEPRAILGDAALLDGRFPLLFKFIDAAETLSVQVHPDEAACARLGAGARPKTEAWYIIDRDPGAKLYAGLNPGVTKAQLATAIEAGTVESLLNEIEVLPGDYVFLPAGTIHAIGGGILLAEVQQSSDTTYRVFDWNRLGLDGAPRALHIEEALEAIDFSIVGTPPAAKPASGRPGVTSRYFEMETVTLQPERPEILKGAGPLVVMGLKGAGAVDIEAHGHRASLRLGETCLVPAAISGMVTMAASQDAHLLSVRIPT